MKIFFFLILFLNYLHYLFITIIKKKVKENVKNQAQKGKFSIHRGGSWNKPFHPPYVHSPRLTFTKILINNSHLQFSTWNQKWCLNPFPLQTDQRSQGHCHCRSSVYSWEYPCTESLKLESRKPFLSLCRPRSVLNIYFSRAAHDPLLPSYCYKTAIHICQSMKRGFPLGRLLF